MRSISGSSSPEPIATRSGPVSRESKAGLVLKCSTSRCCARSTSISVSRFSPLPRGRKKVARGGSPPPPEPDDIRLLAAIEDGLPLCRRPYRRVAAQLGWREQEVIARLQRLLAEGAIARFGLVVRHRILGYRANAMVVWDIDDAALAEIGARLAAAPGVTLCYERPRRPPVWRYNLYSMVHGRDRDQVQADIAVLADSVGPASRGHDILFSRRCFRQRGAKLSAA